MRKITVLIADDHAIIREGLRLILESDGAEVVAEAANGLRAVQEAQRVKPDVVLMDLAMPLLNGVEATRRILRALPNTEVIILSSYSDDGHVQQALEAGASGYVMKETASKDLLRAVREARKGNAYFSPPIAMRLLKQCRNSNPQSKTAAPPELTSRQREIVQLIAEGYSNKKMAGMLFVSIKTVERHRQVVMDKLDIHNVAGLTRYAVSSGVVESNRVPDRALATEYAKMPALSPAELAVA
jgi:DNA-binding NarL/FixJ family response regulator